MNNQLWLKIWEENDTPFHTELIDPYLKQYFHLLSLKQDKQVLVPLCAANNEMVWLAQQGCSVTGIEISPIAVATFFKENAIDYTRSSNNKYQDYQSKNIRILCSDFFDITRVDVEPIHGVYDKGGLIALPPEVRKQYAGHLLELLESNANMLIFTIQYDSDYTEGPPYSIHHEEIYDLFGRDFSIACILNSETHEPPSHLQSLGINKLVKRVYHLQRK